MKFLLYIPAIAWLLASAVFFAMGEYLSKRWGAHPSWSLTAIVVIVYALGTLSWLPALLHKNQLAIMGTIWLLLAVIATVTIGVFVYREHLTSLQLLGVALALVAMTLLNI